MATEPEVQQESPLRRCAFVVPTYNAAEFWPGLERAFRAEGVEPWQVLIVDSMSTDHTRELVRQAGYGLITIPTASFRHGATRQMAAEHMEWAETLLFLTQDAVPTGERPLGKLLAAFDAPEVGAAYGRQLPRLEADGIERHARLFNYPALSVHRTFASRTQVGFRAAFFSNSFAAYRRTAFDQVGGFPKTAIVSEEVSVAARMLLAGWTIAYCSEAEVIHSHPLSVLGEFSRYFDIAVHHAREAWLIDHFGSAGGEGLRFILSELKFLAQSSPHLIPLALLRNGSKWLAYRLGWQERYLPLWSKRAISGQPYAWEASGQGEDVPENSHLLER